MSRHRRWCRACCIAVMLAVTGCVQSPLGSPRSITDPQQQFVLVDGLVLPPVDGVAGCGAQALACALHHAAAAQLSDPATLAAELPWHEKGATPVDLLLEARARGCAARIMRGDRWRLMDAVKRGETIVVMLDAGPVVRTLVDSIPTAKLMHWSVVSGMSRDASRVLLAAENGAHHDLPREVFMRRWAASDNCMLIIAADPAAGH